MMGRTLENYKPEEYDLKLSQYNVWKQAKVHSRITQAGIIYYKA